MSRFIKQGVVRDGRGNVISGANIKVYLSGTDTLARFFERYDDEVASEVIKSDEWGNFIFFVDDEDYGRRQAFKIVVSLGERSVVWESVFIILEDFEDIIVTNIATSGAGNIPVFSDGSGKQLTDSGVKPYVHPNHSGDVTSAGDGAVTISNKAVTLAKMADINSGRLIGRVAVGLGGLQSLTTAQVRALLNIADGANNYSLPTASAITLGGVRVGSRLSIEDGVLSADSQQYQLPTASAQTLGGVKVGNRLSINDGTLSADEYSLPAASAETLGGVRIGQRLTISQGVLSANDQSYSLPTASSGTLGGVKVGSGLSITNGILSANASEYNLPTASSQTLGGVKVGSRLTITNGVLSADLQEGGGSVDVAVSDLDDVDLSGITDESYLRYSSVDSKWVCVSGIDFTKELGNLEDVDVSDIDDGSMLQYDSGNKVWKCIAGITQSIASLTDVDLSTLTDNSFLKYNNSTHTWECAVAVSSLSSLNDVSISSAANKQVLEYNSLSQKWQNATLNTPSLVGLSDVTISNPSNTQALRYNNTTQKWENSNIAAPITSISGMSDISISDPVSSQALMYNGSTNKWENSAIPAQSLVGLIDVDTTNLADDRILRYDNNNSTWKCVDPEGIITASVSDGAITLAKIAPAAAGTKIIASSLALKVIASGTIWGKSKEIYLPRAGIYRISFKLIGSGGITSFARIYRNGSPVGIERSTASSDGVTYTEDVSGWSPGDLCQLYTGGIGSCSDFIISEANPLTPYVLLD